MSETTKRGPLPSDPVRTFYPDACVYGHADEGVEGSVRHADTPRAVAQRNFAEYLGVGFNEVKVRTTYGRALTRQEVWDEHGGRDRVEDERRDEMGLDLKYDPTRDGLDAFWYEDAEGRVVPDAEFEVPEPPADWEPLDDDPVWTECTKDAPGAVKILICEER